MESSITVSICCIVYNQEKYLRQCLDGFVMQKTNFRFEAVVHDDVSQDGSADIIREYAERFPDIIKPIFETENQYSKHDGSLDFIMRNACRGKYIALCEGDDYWTEPDKLQKQVDFIESHPEYSMCFHNAIEHWEDGSSPDKLFSNVQNRDYGGKEIFERWTIPTASVLFRNDVYSNPDYLRWKSDRNFCYGDILIFISAAEIGRIRGMDFCGSVYRRHRDSAVFQTSHRDFFLHNYEIYKEIGGEYKEHARKLFFNEAVALLAEEKKFSTRFHLFMACFKANPVKAIWRFARHTISTIWNKIQ